MKQQSCAAANAFKRPAPTRRLYRRCRRCWPPLPRRDRRGSRLAPCRVRRSLQTCSRVSRSAAARCSVSHQGTVRRHFWPSRSKRCWLDLQHRSPRTPARNPRRGRRLRCGRSRRHVRQNAGHLLRVQTRHVGRTTSSITRIRVSSGAATVSIPQIAPAPADRVAQIRSTLGQQHVIDCSCCRAALSITPPQPRQRFRPSSGATTPRRAQLGIVRAFWWVMKISRIALDLLR